MLNLNDPKLFKTKNYINGQWCASDNQFAVMNPATMEEVAQTADAGPDEILRAIDCASEAFVSWRQQTAKQRSIILRRWYDLMLENIDDLALIMTLEQGKPLAESAAEIHYAGSFIEWFAEECKRAYGRTIPTYAGDRRLQTIKQPVGVVGCITPWNFPAAMLTRKAGPALAAGCSVVARPASETPLSALALCELAERAGLPPGVLNVVAGKDSYGMGLAMTQSDKVAKFTFTGSTGVGRKLMEQCASTIKRISLELGGNAPFLVFDDADLDKAVEACVATKFRNCGQTCVCTNRIYVQESVSQQFIDKLKARISQLKVGVGTEPGVDIGPMVNKRAVIQVQELVDDAQKKGAQLLLGGEGHSAGPCFYQPSLLVGVDHDMAIVREEIFGPVAAVQTFVTEEQAVAKANDTEYGLAAYFFSRDIGRITRVSEALDYGMVASNTGVFSTEIAPFGGIKQSGIGREGGAEGMDEYMEVKYHCIGGVDC